MKTANIHPIIIRFSGPNHPIEADPLTMFPIPTTPNRPIIDRFFVGNRPMRRPKSSRIVRRPVPNRQVARLAPLASSLAISIAKMAGGTKRGAGFLVIP